MARIHIPSPCTADWEAMEGSDQKRFCNLCSKHVHNLSAMTRAQAERVLETPNVCVRFRQDDQGQVIYASRPQRSLKLPLLALGALLGSSPALAAPSVTPSEPVPEVQSEPGWIEWARQQLGALLGGSKVISQGEVEMGRVVEPPPLIMGEVAPEPPPPPPPPPPPILMGKPLPPVDSPPKVIPELSSRSEPGESVIPEVEEALKKQGR